MHSNFFKGNRQRLSQRLPGSIIMLTGYDEMQYAHDQASSFRQDANFWYFSGITEPSWRLIIDTKINRSYAVMPIISQTKVVFDGGLSADRALQISGVDQVLSSDEAESLLRQLRRNHRMVHIVGEDNQVAAHAEFRLNPAHKNLRTFLSNRFDDVRDARPDAVALRAIKQPEEIKLIARAAKISADAFLEVAEKRDSYKYEHEIEAAMTYAFKMAGAQGHAYAPIVAGGANACTLHYIKNEAKISRKSPLLIDAGAYYQNYAADISRTLFIGAPTKRQQTIYDAVKHVYQSCVKLLKPGMGLSELQATADREMSAMLKELGLYENEESLRKYFPHAIGHSLGIDVHDTFGGNPTLKEGMVLTIEPGIYIAEESIGVRYEDNFVITDKGARNLISKRLGDIWYN